METLKARLEEQKGRHQSGSKWIGTGGTSPFGAYGYNPEGTRIGQESSRNRAAAGGEADHVGAAGDPVADTGSYPGVSM